MIIPAIDLIGGKVVRLFKGNYAEKTEYEFSPLERYRTYTADGAKQLHLVDLDGAKDPAKRQLAVIAELIRSTPVPVQVGGGIRSEKDVKDLLDIGANRVVIGSLAVKDPSLVGSLMQKYGPEHIVLALDVNISKETGKAMVAVHGWQEESALSLEQVIEEYRKYGLIHVLCTDISKDGTMQGSNVSLYRRVCGEFPSIKFQASGGIGSLKDIESLKGSGVSGIILGIVGDIVPLARHYAEEGADELVFYDITASSDARVVDKSWVKRVAEVIDIPFAVAGGIRSVDEARTVLEYGADKVSINSPALADPELITRLADEFGVQCVVCGIDSYFDSASGKYLVKQFTGDVSKTVTTHWETMDWIDEVQKRGAGEIVLNMMNQDGMRKGYDLDELKLARAHCSVPLIASGGAGEMKHFADAFIQTDCDGALAASVFHKNIIAIPELKKYLREQGVVIRD